MYRHVCPFQRPKKDKEADNAGGYTCEFVDQPPDDLLCKKCNHVAKKPQQLKSCGEFYCKSCLPSWRLDHFFDHKSNGQIQKLKVKCTNLDQGCDWTGELKDLDDHRSQCPKEEIPCTLSEVGCETRLLRENLDDHFVQNQQQHFHCAVTSISRLRQELATTQGELKELQETFSRSIQTLPKIFKMSNYAQIKETRETWYSTPFYSRKSNDCKVRLCVRPLQASEHVGVALEVLTSLQLSIPAISLTVEVLNQERDDDDAHYSFTLCVSFGSKTHEKRIPVSTYLCDDCLFIRASEKECTEKPWLVDPPMPRRPDLLSEFECQLNGKVHHQLQYLTLTQTQQGVSLPSPHSTSPSFLPTPSRAQLSTSETEPMDVEFPVIRAALNCTKQISDSDILHIVQKVKMRISRWPMFARCLRIEQKHIDTIRLDPAINSEPDEICYQFLSQWCRQVGANATVATLAQVVQRLNEEQSWIGALNALLNQ